MSIQKTIQNFLSDLPDEALGEFAGQANNEVEKRRKRVNIEDIKIGMSTETAAEARREIARVLRDMEGGR